jgi:two-component system osmolarity sensor histidine kinase EnvZ
MRPGLWLKRLLPRTLYGRTLMIVVTPVILTQLVATFVFFDRHWTTMTNRLSYALAGDVGMIVEMVQADHSPEGVRRLSARTDRQMDLNLDYESGRNLPAKGSAWIDPLRIVLEHALDDRLQQSYVVRFRPRHEMVDIYVKLPQGLLTVHSPDRRIYSPTTFIFISWMLGSSIILSIIALVFMRNQIRPIRRLAIVAEEFGKGRDVAYFKPEGAIEVRQAATALLMMRDRLRRQITQRTTMLAGVSHDLRTPLTRMKLQLALMPESPEHTELLTDVEEMVSMVEAYLAFVRGEEGEPVQQVDLETLLQEVVAGARKLNPEVTLAMTQPIMLPMRRQAMKRCLANLVNNAARYGHHAAVTAEQSGRIVAIYVDDDGPGVPSEQREEVFRPFVRLDESRNTTAGSVGLGLTIARDIARLHGGEVLLDQSPMGGLRAYIRLPV